MRLDIISVPIALFAACARATYILSTSTVTLIMTSGSVTVVANNGNRHMIDNPFDGCKHNKDTIKTICMDQGQGRAHLFWKSQPDVKRCFKEGHVSSEICGDECYKNVCQRCYKTKWEEVGCTW